MVDVEALVNPVDCVNGEFAEPFCTAFPDNYRSFKSFCDREELRPGIVFVYDLDRRINPRFIVNFPTKRHWKAKSRLDDIEEGLETLVEFIRRWRIRSIAIPPLGCGSGGLRWDVVEAMIERTLCPLENVHILLFSPRRAASG